MIFYSLKEGFSGLQRARFATFISIMIIALTLSMLSIFALITFNVTHLVHVVQERMNLEIFVDNSIDDKEINILKNKILAVSQIKQVDYISNNDALKRFQDEYGEDLFELLGDNPLPASFVIYLNNTDYTLKQIKSLEVQLYEISGIEDVVYHGDIIHLIEKYSRIVYIADITLFAIAVVTAILLIGNTLRLTILTQKKTIAIMKLVGATRLFILKPYLVQGVLEGAIAGLIAAFIFWSLSLILKWRFPQLMVLPSYLYFSPFYMGIVLGFIGSWAGVKRFLSDRF